MRPSPRPFFCFAFLASPHALAADPTALPPERPALEDLAARQAALEDRILALSQRAASVAADGGPLAGYSGKSFFLRDRDSTLVLIPKGRINVDGYLFPSRGSAPPGVEENGPKDLRPHDSVFLRRARIGFAGTIASVVDFRLEAEFATVPSTGQYGTLTDSSIVLNATRYLEIEAGQLYAPFSLENMTSENFVDFLERSVATRFAVPTVRETGVMAFGEAPQRVARWWLGVFDGEGQDVKNLDGPPAIIGRAIVSPLAIAADHEAWMEDVWIGGSVWRQTSENVGGAAAPSTTSATQGDLPSFTTQSGLAFWTSSYPNAANGAVRSHLAPSGSTQKFALEVNVPVAYRFGVRGELVHQSIGLRQYDDASTAGIATRTPGRAASLSGSGGYAEVYVWLGGDVNVDRPGLYEPPHWRGYVGGPPVRSAVMLAAKIEHVAFDVTGLPARGTSPDPATGRTTIDVFEIGANLWTTRHVRFGMNYVINRVGSGSGPAPAMLEKYPFVRTAEHELLVRWAAQL